MRLFLVDGSPLEDISNTLKLLGHRRFAAVNGLLDDIDTLFDIVRNLVCSNVSKRRHVGLAEVIEFPAHVIEATAGHEENDAINRKMDTYRVWLIAEGHCRIDVRESARCIGRLSRGCAY